MRKYLWVAVTAALTFAVTLFVLQYSVAYVYEHPESRPILEITAIVVAVLCALWVGYKGMYGKGS